MTADSAVFWAFVAAWVLVAAIFVFAIAPRLISEARRIVRRVFALVDGGTLPAQLDKAERDVDRMLRALEAVPVLQERAVRAVETIRTTPVIPPAIGALIARLRQEVRDFRTTIR